MRKKIVFITGTGHCGSTLLDLLLSSHSNIFGLGELWNLSIDPTYLEGKRPLSNINGFKDQFWTSERVKHLSQYFKKNGVLNKLYRRVGLSDNKRANLYRYLFSIINQEILVDSSKNTNWINNSLLSLQNEKNIDLFLIYLTRDGRAVINSYFRKYPERTLEGIAKNWIGRIEKLDQLYENISVSKTKIKYESLSNNPEVVLKEICLFLSIPFEEEMLKFWLHEHHHIGGNSGTKSFLLKFQEKKLDELLDENKMSYYKKHDFGIKLDERWKSELSEQQIAYLNKQIGYVNERILSLP